MHPLLKTLAAVAFAVLAFNPTSASAQRWPPLDCEDVCDGYALCSEYCTLGYPGNPHIYTCGQVGYSCTEGLDAPQSVEQEAREDEAAASFDLAPGKTCAQVCTCESACDQVCYWSSTPGTCGEEWICSGSPQCARQARLPSP
ncbi:hypothetical protein [Vitiosangium sp. GDMCC 1.1324]|uniref:hypothetical protein n=1 Tax=Vitiosangium sp. (strain GDMCC 1.1324) TaxID=2138576 RepID=UPI000D39CB92|nr:hypothetical protein [Vitiosangium sp. GDMCC 1.1324]PTL80275.1 hypothetical protein DAT35_30260 [Vitiosangium sp. GDMCC 1.1324]